MVDWEAHGLAFRCLSRQQKIFTAKLIHQLMNTNRQNLIFYGHSHLCPCCGEEEETLAHLLACRMTNARIKHLDMLQTSLNQNRHPSSPPRVCGSQILGMDIQNNMNNSGSVSKPTRGSCCSPHHRFSRTVS
jgi:hypothetical protein